MTIQILEKVTPSPPQKKQQQFSSKSKLGGGWTNPSEKYARQIGSFPQGSGWQKKNLWNHHPENKDHLGLQELRQLDPPGDATLLVMPPPIPAKRRCKRRPQAHVGTKKQL